jgi:hypothetical protein
MVSNLQKTFENSASTQASLTRKTQTTTSPAKPDTVIKVVRRDWVCEEEREIAAMERAPTYITPRGEKVTLAPVKDVKRKKEEDSEIDDIHDILRLWTRKLSCHCSC